MRREGYELKYLVQKLSSKKIDGVKCEPFERVQIDTPEEYQGSVIQSLSERKGEMLDMISTGNGQTRLVFLVPARGLIGYSTEFLSMTRGYGIMNHTFDQYLPLIPGKLVDVTVVPLFRSMLVRLQPTLSCLSKNVVRSLSTQVLRFTEG